MNIELLLTLPGPFNWDSPLGIFLIVLGAIILTGSIFQLIRLEQWWVRFFDFPHVQITVLNALLLATLILFLPIKSIAAWIFVIALFSALIYQLTIIFPYTTLSPAQVTKSSSEEKPGFTLLEANVYQYNDRYQDLVDIIKKYDPDMVITLETDEGWRQGMEELEKRYRHCFLHPLDNTYGICAYSRLRMEDIEIRHLLSDDVPSVQLTLYVDDNHPITVYIVHPEPPAPQHNTTSTERDAELVIVGREATRCKRPVIVTGDLNDVAWSHTTRLFSRISGLLDPRIGRGFFNTFHAKHRFLRWPLDHIFVSKEFKLFKIERLEPFGSDHFPMLLGFTVEPENGHENDPPDKPDMDDKEEASDKVDRADKD